MIAWNSTNPAILIDSAIGINGHPPLSSLVSHKATTVSPMIRFNDSRVYSRATQASAKEMECVS